MSLELLLHARAGVSLVLATVPQPALRVPRTEAASVDIYVGYADDEFGKAERLGSVPPGGTLIVDYNPDRDRDLRVYQIARTVDGTPDVGQLLDAQNVLVPIQRITEAPAINQATNATHTDVSIGVAGQRYIRILRVEISENSDMSGATVNDYEVADNRISIPITRTAPSSGALTIYVRVSASAGGGFGPASSIQSVTYANDVGAGGSGGSGGYPPGAILPVEHAE